MRITQQQAIFYRLYRNRSDGVDAFLGAGAFQGKIEMPELGESFFMSYECSARLSEMYTDNPELLEREWFKPPRGRRYYCYRIKPSAGRKDIADLDLLTFFDELRKQRGYARAKLEAGALS